MTPDAVLRDVQQSLKYWAKLQATKHSLTRSYNLEKGDIAAHEAEVRMHLEALVAEYGPIKVVRGEVGPAKGWTTDKDDETLLAWAEDNRPALVRRSISQADLTASGAWWKGEKMILDSGEVVPGLIRHRSDGVTISLAQIREAPPTDDDEDES